MREYHNQWRETTCFAKPLDRSPHIIYTLDIDKLLSCQTVAEQLVGLPFNMNISFINKGQ